MESTNKRKSKIVLLIAAIVVAVGAVTVGVMAATGFFKSYKAEAFKLLAQAPEQMNQSYISDWLGSSELMKACEEKGISANIRLSDLKLENELMEIMDLPIDLSEYAVQMDLQADPKTSKYNILESVSKGDDKVTMVMYGDGEKQCIAFPELVSGKYIQIDQEEKAESTDTDDTLLQDSTMEYINSKKYQTFINDLEKFFRDKMSTVYNDIECRKTGDEKYQLTIPKDTIHTVLADFVEFMSGQKDTVDFIDQTYDVDVMSWLKENIDGLSEKYSDIVLTVTGDNGKISELSVETTIDDTPLSVVLYFAGTDDVKTELRLETTIEGEKVELSFVMKDQKTEHLMESLEVSLRVDGIVVGSLYYQTDINTADNQCTIEISVEDPEEGKISLEMEGKIKDLNPGKSLSYTLDRVELSFSGQKIFSAALDLTINTMEGSIEPPEGEAVPVSVEGSEEENTAYAEYMYELMLSGMGKLIEWGLLEESDPMDLTGRMLPDQA